jgi:nitrogen fixation protein FixH
MTRKHIVCKSLSGLILAASLVAAPADAAPLRFAATDTPAGQATLEIQAEELVTMTAIPFRLTINDAGGKPLTRAKVSCDLSMPSMSMPENRLKVVERDGAYAGEMILTCTMGDWRMTCNAEDGKGLRQTMTFDIGTARMK